MTESTINPPIAGASNQAIEVFSALRQEFRSGRAPDPKVFQKAVEADYLEAMSKPSSDCGALARLLKRG